MGRLRVVNEFARGTSKPDIHLGSILGINALGRSIKRLPDNGRRGLTWLVDKFKIKPEPSREEMYRSLNQAREETVEGPDASYRFGWGRDPRSARRDERILFDRGQQQLRERGY